MEKLYQGIGLTPHRSILIHLLFVGIPLWFGLMPTGWAKPWIPDDYYKDPCSIFGAEGFCMDFERFMLLDFGMRFALHYELAIVVWFVMRTSTSTAVRFHKLLMGISFVSLLILAWLQNYMRPSLKPSELDEVFFGRTVLFYLLALAISAWTVAIYPSTYIESMKWSIPGNAIFCGAVSNVFVAIASFQALLEENGVEKYYTQPITTMSRICFTLAAFHTAVHAVLLFRIRNFLTMPQLRSICLYKVVFNVALPFFWFPDTSDFVIVDKRLTYTIRVCTTLTYVFGFLWAGKAEGVSRILTSEKEK